MKHFLKRFCCIIMALCIVAGGQVFADFAGYEGKCETVTAVYTGTTTPNALVSFMVIAGDGNFSSLQADDIYQSEIIKADEKGNFSYVVTLKDAQFDSQGNIINYKLNSSIKDIDINSGYSADRIYVQIDDVFTEFAVPPREVDGVVFMPIAETFEKLGVPLAYDADTKTYTGEGNNGDIEIVMGLNTAEIDWVDVEMPAPSQNIDGVDMIPLYIIEDAVRTDPPVYNQETKIVSIQKPEEGDKAEEVFDIAKVVETLPQGTVVMSNSQFLSMIRMSTGKEYATISKTEDTLRITTRKNAYGEIPSEISGIQFPVWASKSFGKGETGLISFKARAISTQDDSGNANVSIMYQRTTDWQKAMSEQIAIRTGDWQQFYLPVYSSFYDMNVDKAPHVMLQVGGKPMDIEIKDFSFVNYGTAVPIETLRPADAKPYKGMGEDALWRKEAYRRIEKYRKNDMKITVADEQGNPVKNAQITVDMTDNEFMFGVSLCASEILDLDLNSQSGKIYNDLVTNDFNTAVCGLEMKAAYAVEDDAEDGIRMVNEFLSRGKRMRGHAVLWDGEGLLPFQNPEDMSYDELYDALLTWTQTMAYAFKGKVEQWDVLNEPCDSNLISSRFNTTKLYTDVFKQVHEIDPEAKLYVNETGIEGKESENISDRVPSLVSKVERMKREGAPIDGIGIQAHCTAYHYPQGFYHQLDECASVVDEVAVTEYDFQNQNTEYADEHLRDTLLATFSHPKATAFIVWGVQDTMHWRNAAPFYDANWNERPALDVWQYMVNEEFSTHETVQTGQNGTAAIRGFRGDYNITCKVDGKEYTVPFRLIKDGENTVTFTVRGNSISAQVSNAPEEKPDSISYSNLIEAREAYETETPAAYEQVYFDTAFKGSRGVENDAVLNGGQLGSSYEAGEAWGSQSGISGFAAGGDDNAVYLKTPGTVQTADLRHKLSLSGRAPDTNLSFDLVFDTLTASGSGDFSAELALQGEDSYPLGKLRYQNGQYTIETADGKIFALDRNAQYTLRVTLVYDPDGYFVKYEILDVKDTVLNSHTDQGAAYADIADIQELCMTFSSSAGTEENLFKLYDVRVWGSQDGEIIFFEPVRASAVLFSDSMRNFDLTKLEYLGTDPGAGTAKPADPQQWGLYGAARDTNAFAYETYGHYLYAMRNAPTGKNVLARGFEPIQAGDTLSLTYHMYINGAAQWFDSAGGATVALGSADKTVSLDISSFEYDPYHGFWVNIFDEQNAVTSYTKNDWNWVDLTVFVQLIPNAQGNYDAAVRVSNDYGFLYERTVADVLTAEDAQKISTLFITSRTDSGGSRYGANICGFKEIKVEKTTEALEERSDGLYGDQNLCRFEIPYQNITGRRTEATVIAGLYQDGKLCKIESFPYVLEKGEGTLWFSIEGREQADMMKVFAISDMQNIIPFKQAEKIKVK